MEFTEEIIPTDVLVIGGGLAGSWAALRARELGADVTLVEKANLASSGATVYCHNALASPLPEEDFSAWMKELVEYADYYIDQECLEILLKEEGKRLEDLNKWGVPFVRGKDGKIQREAGRGHKTTKVVVYDGRRLMMKIRQRLLEKGVRLIERVMATDLLTSDGFHPTDGKVQGAVALHTRTGQFFIFPARAVVVATGLMGSKISTSFANNLTGEGQAMAYRVGAEMVDLEFTQVAQFASPLRDRSHAIAGGLIVFQTQGAYIVNALGERIMGKYVPDRMERGSGFGLLSKAMAKEVLEGRGPIYFDMRHWEDEKFEHMRRILPVTMASFAEAGIDFKKDLVETTLLSTCSGGGGNGGINIGLEGETNIPGLFACGVAAKFKACIEDVSGAPQAFCNVFGYRAGERAAKEIQESALPEIDKKQIVALRDEIYSPLKIQEGIRAHEIYLAMNRAILPVRYSIFKHEKRIRESSLEIERIERDMLPKLKAVDLHDLIKANEVKSILPLLRLFFIAASERKESRFSHYREEYPYSDPQWLKRIVLRQGKEELILRYEPIPLERYPIKKPVLERVPAPIQYSYEN